MGVMHDGASRNWARNQQCTPAAREEPRSVLEVAEAVRRARVAGQTVKVVGSGHSFTDVACTEGRMMWIDLLDRVLDVDRDAGTVTVEAGITIRALNRELAERGLALANLGDIDRQTIAGATSTGTHGTGARLGGTAPTRHLDPRARTSAGAPRSSTRTTSSVRLSRPDGYTRRGCPASRSSSPAPSDRCG